MSKSCCKIVKDHTDEIRRIIGKAKNNQKKIDIEHFECRAFLGSPEILRQNQDVNLLAVIMEWTFLLLLRKGY